MSRAIGFVVVLLLLAATLPTLAAFASAAIPALLSVLVLLGIARLAVSPRRRR